MPASQMQAGSKVDRPTPDMVVSMGLDAQLQAFRPMNANQRTSIDHSPGAFMQLCRRNHWTAPAIAAHVGGYRSNWAATTHKRPPTWLCYSQPCLWHIPRPHLREIWRMGCSPLFMRPSRSVLAENFSWDSTTPPRAPIAIIANCELDEGEALRAFHFALHPVLQTRHSIYAPLQQ